MHDVLLHAGSEPQVIVTSSGRDVAVPWRKLVFATPGKMLHGAVVLPGATLHALEELPAVSIPPNRQKG